MNNIENLSINVYSEIWNENAVSLEDWSRVYSKIFSALKKWIPIDLDFKNISLLTSPFLHVAIGQLYKNFDGIFLAKHIKVSNLDNNGKSTIKMVTDSAKKYYLEGWNGKDLIVKKVLWDE